MRRVVLAGGALGLVATGGGVTPSPTEHDYAHVRLSTPVRVLVPAKTRDRWPGGVVPYFSAAREHEWAVRQAVSAWNGSGAQVRFVATTAATARLVIRSDAHEKCGEGRATLGYHTKAVTFIFRPGAGYGCDRFSAARVLAHELGHVLGLAHVKGTCAVMNSTGDYRGSRRCRASERWEWRCRLVEPGDALAAAKLYGGTPAVAHGPATCALYQPGAERSGAHQAGARAFEGRRARDHVRAARDIDTPGFLGGETEPSFALATTRGRCAGKPEKGCFRWEVNPGEEQVVFERVRARGVHCVRVWAADRVGRPSETPATLEIDVK